MIVLKFIGLCLEYLLFKVTFRLIPTIGMLNWGLFLLDKIEETRNEIDEKKRRIDKEHQDKLDSMRNDNKKSTK